MLPKFPFPGGPRRARTRSTGSKRSWCSTACFGFTAAVASARVRWRCCWPVPRVYRGALLTCDLSASAIRSVLVGIASSFRQTGARGLILDDMPADADNSLIYAIGQVARAVTDADGVLIVTSVKPPQPTLRSRLGLDEDAIIRVPYLTSEDVANIVNAAGGDPQKWARSIQIFAGGHPQLVDARVAGLEQRGWNEKEMLADILPLKDTPDDVEEERKAVRSRLLEELPSNALELLLRLSLLHGNFDRPMALVVAGAQTAVPQAGLFFDFLAGPWIEQVGPERYRLSPLLKDSGTAALPLPLQRSIKTKVMNYLIKDGAVH